MLVSLNDITKYAAKAEDLSASVADVFVNQDDWSVSYVAIDLGGWFDDTSAVIASDRLAHVAPDEREITLDIAKADAEAAPDLADKDGITAEKTCLMLDYRDGRAPPEPCASAASATATRYVSMNAAVGMDAYHDGTQVGRLVDLLAASETLKVSHAVIDTGTTLAKAQRIVPIEKIDHVDIGAARVEVRLSAQQIEDGPALEGDDRLDRNWMDRVAAYYGLTG